MKHWTTDAIFYQIYPLGFCGAPRFHQDAIEHRITKIKDWIPHLQKMKINALYLGPVFESFEHGYDTSDYQLVDHRLGNNEDFKDVCQALHDAGMKVVLDGVFNHVGRGFWAFKDVQKKGANSPYCGWFHNLNFGNRSPEGDAFSYAAWEGHFNLVKLNLQNEEVVQYLLQSIAMWMDEFHIDGLRLDAADCIDRNFFKRLKQFCMEKDEHFWLMGEIIHGDYNVWANTEMLDTVTNYECYKGLYSSHNEKNYFEIAYSLNRQFGNGGIYKNLNLYNFVDNHDVNRLASVVKDKTDLKNIYTMLYTIPGIPSIYYGSEWGLEGTKHDGSDADIRPELELASFADGALLQHICQLGNVRNELSPLSHGSYEQVLVRNEQFVFKRIEGSKEVYIFFNVSENPYECEISIPFKAVRDVLEDQVYLCNNHKLNITLKPKQAYILTESSCDEPNTVTTEKHPNTVEASPAPLVEHKEEAICTHIKQKPQDAPLIKSETQTIRPGRYAHFKGKHYAVLYVAKHSETLEDYVVYRQLYGEEEVWVRPLCMFTEQVEVAGERIPRFQYVGK